MAPLEGYLPIARRLGVERFVFVQPSAYGSDNRCLLDALRTVGPERGRGVVVLDDEAPVDRTLADWHEVGVRGLRVFGFPAGQAHAASSGSQLEHGLADEVRRVIARHTSLAQELGWHLDLLLPAPLVAELMPTLRQLPVDFTLAHLGLFPASGGIRQAGFADLVGLMAEGGRHCWIKLTAPYRLSSAPGFVDVHPMARELIVAAPDRVLWGSDYPHLSFEGQVDTVDLFGLLDDWAPDEHQRRRVLVDNPAALYAFGRGLQDQT